MFIRIRQQESILASQVILLFQKYLGSPTDVFLASCCFISGTSSHCVSTTSFAKLKGGPTTLHLSLLCYLMGWSDWQSVAGTHVGNSVITFRNTFKNGLLNAFLKEFAILLKVVWFGKWKLFIWGPWWCNDLYGKQWWGSNLSCIYFHEQNRPPVIYSRHCNFMSMFSLLLFLF